MTITRQDLSAKAFNMFRDWTKNVRIKYPTLNLVINDETILVTNLTNTIESAGKSLLMEEKLDKRNQEGFDIGFVSGFISSNLNVVWHFEYIIKQTKEYKEFLALKAIKLYLGFDSLTNIRITAIYKGLLSENSNVESINDSISAESINEISLVSEDENFDNAILQTLNNKVNQYVNDYLLQDIENFMEPSENYFSNSEIQYLIDHNFIV